MPRPESLSVAQARRVAVAAQGLARQRPQAVGLRQVTSCIDRMGVLQIDSVNVLARSQFLPLFARLGPYDQHLLTRAAHERPRRITEYWAHQAAFIPVNLLPLFRWRMAAYEREAWGSIRRAARENPALVADVLAGVTTLGPITPSQLTRELGHDPSLRRDHWGWNWTSVKTVCEYLFFTGQIVATGRTTQFERVFDLPSRALPPRVLAAPALCEADAHRELIQIAARAHGVGTVRCLADYWRTRLAPTRTAIADLVDAGVLQPVSVEGTAAYLHRDAALTRQVNAQALLSPFDPLIWERGRTHWLFGMHYRIGIYTPAARRTHGYYVLPFLLDDALVARVDLKADRTGSRLLVQSAWQEPGMPNHAPEQLAAELRLMAHWLGLDDVVVTGPGDLAAQLARTQVAGSSPRD